MPPPYPRPNGGWTFETLLTYLLTIIEANDRRYAENKAAVELAVHKAQESVATRLMGMNEFRDTLRDQAGTFSTRSELATLEKSLDVRIKNLETNRANMEGRLWALGAAVTVINITIAVVGFLSSR